MSVAIRDATPADRAMVIRTLARAFADDPAMCYIFPNPARRAHALPRLFSLFFATDAAGWRLVADAGTAVTLWRPPDHAEDRPRAMLRHLLPLLMTFGAALPRAMRVGDAIAAHFPRDPFWYLHIAGVEPAQQGRGLGGAAIRAGLVRCDAAGIPAYLETATARNVGLYQSLGFVVCGEWDVPRGGPHFWSMMRPASGTTVR